MSRKPLHIQLNKAIELGDLSKVSQLLAAGADPNKPYDGEPPLFYASILGHTEIVKKLLEAGAIVDTPNKNGETALYAASGQWEIEIVRLLLAAGADVDRRSYGKTPLYEACDKGLPDFVKLLLSAGASVDKENNGVTALQRAATDGHTDIVTILLSNGATVDKETNEGKTALYAASFNGFVDIVKILLMKGANPNKVLKQDNTALYVASQEGRVRVVKALIDAGANVNQQVRGYFPLFIAAHKGRLNVVKTLIAAGAEKSERLINEARAGIFKPEINELILGGIHAPNGDVSNASLPKTAPPANTASLSTCFDPIMANNANISPSMAVFYIQNATGSTISTGCLDEESLDTYKSLESFAFYRCKDTVPVSALHITADSVFPTKYRKLAFAMNVYVHDAEFQKTQIGKMYVLRPVEPLGRIASESVVKGGSVVSANHCGPASTGDVLYSIHEVSAAATGGRRSRRKTYKKSVRKHRKTFRRHRRT